MLKHRMRSKMKQKLTPLTKRNTRMRMQKRTFRIGHLAKELEVERFVIRFWEKEFSVKTKRTDGGQRFYDEEDFEKFKLIKQLLYKEGFTIAGAKKQIEVVLGTPESNTKILASHKTTIAPDEKAYIVQQQEQINMLNEHIQKLQKQLSKLKELL